MIYDRPYMKTSPVNGFQNRSMVMQLLIINIAVFVVQNVFGVLFNQFSIVGQYFALSGAHIIDGKLWTLLSYSFLHSAGYFHILGNMFGLYFIGRVIEPIIGPRPFLYLYLFSALIGAFFYLSLNYDTMGLLVGASASVSGLLAFFCLLKPEDRITLLVFFIIPVSIKPKWLLRFYLIITLFSILTAELQGTTNIAHSAHLGGLLTGFLYYQFFYKKEFAPFSAFKEPSIELPSWLKKQNKTQAKVSYKVNYSKSHSELKEEVNKILDKINDSGFESLNDDEKTILHKARSSFKK